MQISRSIFATLAIVTGSLVASHANAQAPFGAPQQPSPQVPGQAPVACYPTPSCHPTINIPVGAIVPHPNPGTPGSSPENCLVIENGCPVPGSHYTVHKYYYVYYKIVNKNVPYDQIDVQYHGLPKVCSADAPCPPCVKAGGYGKADHAGTISDVAELKNVPEKTTTDTVGAPTQQVESKTEGATAESTVTPVKVEAPKAPAPANTTVGQWNWFPAEGFYAFGVQRPDGMWDIDRSTATKVPPAAMAAK